MISDIPRWLALQSSNVKWVRYNRQTRELDVKFKPGLQFARYYGIPIEAFVDMIFSESIGSYFANEIKAFAFEGDMLPQGMKYQWRYLNG